MTVQETSPSRIPYFLLIVHPESDHVRIDVEEPGWMKTYADWMRGRSQWFLVRKKDETIMFGLDVFEGEQPYYASHHVGLMGSGGGNEIIACGIGKKQVDGTMVRLWILPNGLVCAGDDVDTFGIEMIRAIGPR
jgi:hypothetical protein